MPGARQAFALALLADALPALCRLCGHKFDLTHLLHWLLAPFCSHIYDPLYSLQKLFCEDAASQISPGMQGGARPFCESRFVCTYLQPTIPQVVFCTIFLHLLLMQSCLIASARSQVINTDERSTW